MCPPHFAKPQDREGSLLTTFGATLWLVLIFAPPHEVPIAHLINQLGDEQFVVRERAMRALEALGVEALPALEAARFHPNPEVARRADVLVERYYAVKPTQYDFLPWIDMLPTDYPNRQVVIDTYLTQARTTGDWWRWTPGWPDYRYATYLLTRDLLKAGQTRAQVVALLDRMAANELNWLRQRHQPRYTPPPQISAAPLGAPLPVAGRTERPPRWVRRPTALAA